MENIAAVRGSLLTPFGSPQNLFIYGQSGVSAGKFIGYMFPIWVISGVLLILFTLLLYGKNIKQKTQINSFDYLGTQNPENKVQRIAYLIVFLLVIGTIVTRTSLWLWAVLFVAAAVFVIDKQLLLKTNYVYFALLQIYQKAL